ncbi:ABC transporter ATP-binding protein [Fervidicoccus fontis]|uniref:ABC transporter related protein n=1 Tax=Fervidicoccus fontis (strain DSM 19380 / JCM 18336 / VKM B-2539 / Kam940) TaxID=1163730 RepID=H9ZZW9_FERFK|nr:ABC transporter ATP-binding protein [Fervidicoccus fontis]AFH42276.1 ABC transporter related protein [Fervidicoccus fontis Kam940]
MNLLLSIKNLSKSFKSNSGEIKVIDNISLDIYNEFFVILGPSGCGKSTLLRIIAGVDKPTSGNIIFQTGKPPRFGFVFQFPSLIPWITVLENVAIVLKNMGIPKNEAEESAKKYLSIVGLSGFENVYPYELSGGMRQRVNLARALSVQPEILLMDEPFSNLDPLTAENLRAEILDIWLSNITPMKAIIMVTHSVDEAIFLADRIVILTPRPSKISNIVNVDLPRPRNRRSPEFEKIEDLVYSYVS